MAVLLLVASTHPAPAVLANSEVSPVCAPQFACFLGTDRHGVMIGRQHPGESGGREGTCSGFPTFPSCWRAQRFLHRGISALSSPRQPSLGNTTGAGEGRCSCVYLSETRVAYAESPEQVCLGGPCSPRLMRREQLGACSCGLHSPTQIMWKRVRGGGGGARSNQHTKRWEKTQVRMFECN